MCSRYSRYRADSSKWKRILVLAHRWGFKEMRHLAFEELSRPETGVPTTTLVALGERYDATGSFIGRAIAELAMRPKSLNEDEGEEIGGRMAVRVMEMRSQHQSQTRSRNWSHRGTFDARTWPSHAYDPWATTPSATVVPPPPVPGTPPGHPPVVIVPPSPHPAPALAVPGPPDWHHFVPPVIVHQPPSSASSSPSTQHSAFEVCFEFL
jgi:hypothetical protein